MSRLRAFYITQGSLTVWMSRRRGDLVQVAEFADSDDGFRQFDECLAETRDQPGLVVIDVIEEEFSPDSIPKLRPRDRSALMMRRNQRKFPRTPYRLPVYCGENPGDSDEAMVMHSAIANHELLDPWLRIIVDHQVPLAGIYSVPLMAPELMRRLSKNRKPTMLLAQHQGQKLRQVFMRNGQALSARLSQSPPVSDPDYPQFVLTEISRSRRYMERNRLLGRADELDVYVIAAPDLADSILACDTNHSLPQIHFVRPEAAAQKVGLNVPPASDHLEALYLAMSLVSRPLNSYAVSGETRYWSMRRLRQGVIGAVMAIGAVCSLTAGYYLSHAWILHRKTAAIEEQLAQLTETFRRENDRFEPIKVDSHEMKLAVDTGDFILTNRLPVPWVMQQIGLVMGDFPDVRISNLGWSAETATAELPRAHRSDQPMPVPVPIISTVNAELTADIRSFDGDMRRAFARIDELVADLEARTMFNDVVAVEYPLDARPEASITGEIVSNGTLGTASFRLRLTYSPEDPVKQAMEGNDETV